MTDSLLPCPYREEKQQAALDLLPWLCALKSPESQLSGSPGAVHNNEKKHK